MNYDYKQSDLSRSVLGGLFSRLIATVANIAFILIYRAITSYYDFGALDILIIVFGSILLSMACGIMFYFFVHNLKQGISFYRIMVIVTTVAIVYAGIAFRGTFEDTISNEFKILVTGTQIIIGLLAAFSYSISFRHDSIIS